MLFHVITVSKQVLVLFILIGIGFLLAKLKVMSKEGARVCSDLALYLATPCVILKSFSPLQTACAAFSQPTAARGTF